MDLDVDGLSEMAARLGTAVALGGILGLDREVRRHDAGLRTHMLVALGAATMTLVALYIYRALSAENPQVNADPLRVIEGVTAAIGFIGAGAILQRKRGGVHGLTTAANIWMCGAIGIAAGAGFYDVAIASFVLTLIILSLLRILERRIAPSGRSASEEDEAGPAAGRRSGSQAQPASTSGTRPAP